MCVRLIMWLNLDFLCSQVPSQILPMHTSKMVILCVSIRTMYRITQILQCFFVVYFITAILFWEIALSLLIVWLYSCISSEGFTARTGEKPWHSSAQDSPREKRVRTSCYCVSKRRAFASSADCSSDQRAEPEVNQPEFKVTRFRPSGNESVLFVEPSNASGK